MSKRIPGSVRLLPSGKFQARIMLDGERVREALKDDPQREAEKWLLWHGRAGTGGARATSRRIETLRTWGVKWLDLRELSGTVRGIQQDRSPVAVRRSMKARFIDWPLRKIKRKHVQRVRACPGHDGGAPQRPRSLVDGKRVTTYDQGSGDPSAGRPPLRAMSLLRVCLRDAADAGKIASNPALDVIVPKVVEAASERTFLTLEEVKRVTAATAPKGKRADYPVPEKLPVGLHRRDLHGPARGRAPGAALGGRRPRARQGHGEAHRQQRHDEERQRCERCRCCRLLSLR